VEKKVLNLILYVFSLFWVFGAGLFVYKSFLCRDCPKGPSPSSEYVPFQREYDLVLISKDLPRRAYSLDYVVRDDISYGYIYVYDGSSWRSVQLNEGNFAIQDLGDQGGMTSSIKVGFSMGRKEYRIEVPEIATPITIKSSNDYSKFAGATKLPTATVNIDGDKTSRKFYAALLRGFNTNIYNLDLVEYGVNTDWLLFWDQDWNFYHLDKTTVEKFHPSYKSHSVFVRLGTDEASDQLDIVHYSPDILVRTRDNLVEVFSPKDASSPKISFNKGSSYKRVGYSGLSEGFFVDSSDGGVGLYQSIRVPE
jgi:hypothetical protein